MEHIQAAIGVMASAIVVVSLVACAQALASVLCSGLRAHEWGKYQRAGDGKTQSRTCSRCGRIWSEAV
jgi:hypothetical protein